MNLDPAEVELYYRLHYSVLAYANRQLGVVAGCTDWEGVKRCRQEEKVEMRGAFYEHPELLEEFLAENPEGLPCDELAIVASWRQRVAGNFYIVRYLIKYTVFLGVKPERLYGVLGLADPLEMMFAGHPLPVYVRGVLLPFRDRIVYDGLLSVYSIFFGPGIRSDLKETYNRLKSREGIVEQLAGPHGKPEVQTSVDRQKPRKPAPDWGPVVDGIVAQTEKMRQADTPEQGAALGLLRAAVQMAQATLRQPDDVDEHLRRVSSVQRALTRLKNMLYEYGEE